eukprot:PhF_6_TR37848/c0_g1_i2/m.56359
MRVPSISFSIKIVIAVSIIALITQAALMSLFWYQEHRDRLRLYPELRMKNVAHVMWEPQEGNALGRAVRGLAEALQRAHRMKVYVIAPKGSENVVLLARGGSVPIQSIPLQRAEVTAEVHAGREGILWVLIPIVAQPASGLMQYNVAATEVIEALGHNISFVHCHGAHTAPTIEFLRANPKTSALVAREGIAVVYSTHDVDIDMAYTIPRASWLPYHSVDLWSPTLRAIYMASAVETKHKYPLGQGRVAKIPYARADAIVFLSRHVPQELKTRNKHYDGLWDTLCDASYTTFGLSPAVPNSAEMVESFCDHNIQLHWLRRV